MLSGTKVGVGESHASDLSSLVMVIVEGVGEVVSMAGADMEDIFETSDGCMRGKRMRLS